MPAHEVAPPTAERQRLARSMKEHRPLAEVVEAVADAVRWQSSIYVERRGGRYRWSPATGGGPYRLLRMVCKFLQIPHHWVLVSTDHFQGLSVVASRDGEPVDAAAVVQLPLGAGRAKIRRAVVDAVGRPGIGLQ